MRSQDRNVFAAIALICVFILYLMVHSPSKRVKYLTTRAPKEGLVTPTTLKETVVVKSGERIIWAPPECDTKPAFYDPKTRHSAWWKKMYMWETYNQKLWCDQISPKTTYIGFGEWIGPTAILAASLGARAIALEPDPIAMVDLKANVAVNPDLDIVVSNLCVAEERKWMKMAVNGGSGSVVANVKHNFENKEHNADIKIVDVECITLPEAIELFHISMESHVFIKSDTEGGERFLTPAISPWLAQFATKPDMAISYHPMHSEITKGEREEHCNILNTYMYKYYTPWNKKETVKVVMFTENILSMFIDVFVSDRT